MRMRNMAPLGVVLIAMVTAACKPPDVNVRNNNNVTIQNPVAPTPVPTPTPQPSGKPGPFEQTGSVGCPITQTGERTISFSWTGSANATAYVITERYRLNGGPLTLGETRDIAPTTTATFTRRRTAATYMYTVTAKNPSGFTIWNNGEWTAPCVEIRDVVTSAPPTTTPPPTTPGPTTPGPTTPGPTGPTGPTNSCVLTKPLTPSSGSGKQGTAGGVNAAWSGSGCPGWYYSSDPAFVHVDPNSGAIKYIKPGATQTVCAQPSSSIAEPKTCGTFTTTP